MEETGLIFRHATGISFELTPEETLNLLDFLSVYREALVMTQCDTEPYLERVVVKRTRENEDDR
jgi:hypothetical protein